MIKKYISGSQISVNVVLEGGLNRRIAFTSMSDGTSQHVTADTEEQQALERHYRYGSLFHLTEVEVSESEIHEIQETAAVPAHAVVVNTVVVDDDAAVDGATTSAETEPVVLSFADLAEAKEYLASTYGVGRTSMKGEKSIRAVANKFGIELKIGE